jgi:hypothetical protein
MSSDEQRMLAATNQIMKQLNELEVDNVRIISAGATAPKATMDDEYLSTDSDEEEEEDESTLMLRTEHGVEIQPYACDEELEDDEERQTNTEETSSNGESTTEEPQVGFEN